MSKMMIRRVLFITLASVASGCPASGDDARIGDNDVAHDVGAREDVGATEDDAREHGELDIDMNGPEPRPERFEPWIPVKDEPFDIVIGERDVVYEPPADFNLGSFPEGIAVPRGDGTPGTKVIVSFSENEDDAGAAPRPRTLRTLDDGATYKTLDAVAMVNSGLLADGTLLALGFVPQWTRGDTRATIPVARSTDAGATWAKSTATFDAGETIRGLRFHRGLTQIRSGAHQGTILVAFYALFGSDRTRTVGLAASQDDGETWTRWGTIAPPNHPTRTYDETTFAFTGRGEVIAVTRAYEDGNLGPLLISRSEDEGQTFSSPEPIMITFGDEAPATRSGVDPGLTLLPNGVLALVGGRPDNWIAFSRDGGHTWGDGHITYVNYSAQHRFHGSSGYQAVIPSSTHRLFVAGDNCANSWGCPESDNGWTVDGEYRIWRRLVDVVPRDPGRIDLASEALHGSVTVTLTEELTAENPQLDGFALFDGSIEPGSAIRGEGTITVDLGKPRTITRLGIAGAAGSEATTVRLFDGQDWIVPEIATGPDGDLFLNSFVPEAPRPIERIEIVSGPGGGVAELELYSTVNSFENETLGAAPRAVKEATMVEVVAVDGERSRQALRLHDTGDDAMASVVFAFNNADSNTVASFRIRAASLPGAMLFGIGTETDDRLHFSLDAEGRLRQFDDESQTWTEIAPAGTIDPFEWFDVRLGSTSLVVRDIPIAFATIPASAPATLYITSTGTVPVGVDLLLDDLAM